MNSEKKDILRFIVKAILMALPVLIPACLFFVMADPFMVFASPEQYFPSPESSPVRVGLNKGMVTVKNYEDLVKKGYTFNSFIFGSSTSDNYRVSDWTALIEDNEAVRPYHFDSSSETLEQMYEKIKYLDEQGAEMRHVLIVMDALLMMSGQENDDMPAFISPPQFGGGFLHALKYYYVMFKATTNSDFLKSWIGGVYYGYPIKLGRNAIHERQPIVYDRLSNEERLPHYDSLIAVSPEEFYASERLDPVAEHVTIGAATLTQERENILLKMREVFRRHDTDYRIIIGPNRKKLVLNPADKAVLTKIFGTERVHDFSGKLVDAVDVDTLFYDNTHYRPVFARRLMELAY